MITALSIAVLALGFSTAAPPDSPASRVRSSPTPSPSSAGVERLRRNGLRPDDPQLVERLAELAKSRRRPPASTAKVRFDVTNVKFPKVSVFKNALPLAQPNATLPSGMGTVFNGVHAKPAIQQVQIGNLFGAPYLDITGANLIAGTSYASTTVSADIGPCGQRLLPVLTGSNLNPKPGAVTVGGVFVAKDTPAAVTVTVAGVSSDPIAFTYPAVSLAGSPFFATATLSISDSAPFMAGDGGLGLPKTAFSPTTTADRISTNISGAPGSGTDTIGYGINLVNGWTATATVKNVHSMLDAPANDGSNDQFRSAVVVQQPQSGRFETKIAWKYQAGESISYDIVWQFNNGIAGTRQVATQAKQTTCTDEG